MRREIGWLADRQPMLITEDEIKRYRLASTSMQKGRRLSPHFDQASIEHAASAARARHSRA